MIVELNLKKGYCKITKEGRDPRYTRGYALPESRFLYHVQQELKRQGYDVIKRRMWRDGHLVDDLQQYVRTRVFTNTEGWAVYNSGWQFMDAGLEFNRLKAGDSLCLTVVK